MSRDLSQIYFQGWTHTELLSDYFNGLECHWDSLGQTKTNRRKLPSDLESVLYYPLKYYIPNGIEIDFFQKLLSDLFFTWKVINKMV